MRKLAGLAIVLLLTGAAPALADHPGSATSADLRALQSDVDRLDDSLVLVDNSHPRAREFRQREGEVRDRLVWLRGHVRRHQQNPDRGLGATKSEVDSIHQEIVSLRRDIESSGVGSGRGDYGDIRVPDGTEIQIRLDQPLSSKTARREDRIVATVTESVRQDGRVAIPAGTEMRGTVREVEPAQRPAHGARLEMSFDQMQLGGRMVDIQSRLVSVNEGRVDKKKTGLGAILGGVIGGVLSGTKGAVIGAIVGGTGAVVATKGDDVELPAGTLLTPKFECVFDGGEVLKVKYGRNPEIHTEVAATRLLERLGAGADRVYLVKTLRCFGCPEDPHEMLECISSPLAEVRRACQPKYGETTPDGGLKLKVDYTKYVDFGPVAIERRMEGKAIETKDKAGWGWDESEELQSTGRGATRAERDALRLMAVFLNHWDKQERKLDVEGWRAVPIWDDPRTCRVTIKSPPLHGATFSEATISETGRQFLAERLSALSEGQIRDLFGGSRFARFRGGERGQP